MKCEYRITPTDLQLHVHKNGKDNKMKESRNEMSNTD